MQKNSYLKIDHPFDEHTVEELQVMRELRLHHYETLAADMPLTVSLLGEQGVNANVFVLKQEIDEKISELKRRLAEHDQAIYLDEVELYLSSLDEPNASRT